MGTHRVGEGCGNFQAALGLSAAAGQGMGSGNSVTPREQRSSGGVGGAQEEDF